MTHIYFWRGAIAHDSQLLTDFQPILHKLLTNDYNASDLEQLKGHRGIYSYRLNRVERLLLTTWKKNGQTHLLLLEHLPTHDYQKSRFLQSGVLKRFLISHADAAQEADFEGVHAPLFDASDAPEREDELSIFPMDYHHEFIQLNLNQERALSVSLPSLITGSAGSGKSCVAMLLLANRLYQFHLDSASADSIRLLYVTTSEHLVNQMRLIWADQPVLQCIDPMRVNIDFCTPETLIAQHTDLQEKRFTTDETWQAWCNTKYTQYKKMKKTGLKHAFSHLDTPEKLLEEFRICSGYSRTNYLKLGARQSTVTRDLRESVLDLYHHYLTDNEQSGFVDANFSTSSCGKNKYHLVVVDEAQNCSHAQLHDFSELAIDHSIAYCMDSHQYLNDKLSKRSFLVDELSQRFRPTHPITEIQLNVGYRCSVFVSQIANVILDIKHHVQGGILDQNTTQALSPIVEGVDNRGSVYLLHPGQNTPDWLLEQARGTQLAVITSDDVLAEPEERRKIERLFQTPNILSVSQSQGLQYSTIIAYRLLADSEMKALKEALASLKSPAAATSAKTYHRPKADSGSDKSTLFLNRIYTAYTRALQNLIIYEPPIKFNQPFFDLIKSYLTHVTISPFSEITSNEEHWLDAARLQLKLGNTALARDICLKKTTISWSILQEEHEQRCVQSGLIAQQSPRFTPPAASDTGAVKVIQSKRIQNKDLKIEAPRCAEQLKETEMPTAPQKTKKLKYIMSFFETPFTMKRFDDFLEKIDIPMSSWLLHKTTQRGHTDLFINQLATNSNYIDIFLSVLCASWQHSTKMAEKFACSNKRDPMAKKAWLSMMNILKDHCPCALLTLTEQPFLTMLGQSQPLFTKSSNELYLFIQMIILSNIHSIEAVYREPAYRTCTLVLLTQNYLYWLAAFDAELMLSLFNPMHLKQFISCWQVVPLSRNLNMIELLGESPHGELLLHKLISDPLYVRKLTEYPVILRAISSALRKAGASKASLPDDNVHCFFASAAVPEPSIDNDSSPAASL